MAAAPRSETVDPFEVAVHHCFNRCVRQERLCGDQFEYRRQWIRDHCQMLAQLFAVEITFHGLMGNHLHFELRSRPDIVRTWSDPECLERWMRISKSTKAFHDDWPEIDERLLAMRLAERLPDAEYLQQVRRNLSDISCLMGALEENIARRANAEDGTHGHFWESRYKNLNCVDETGILLCGLYIDLNQVRAGEAPTPEDSRWTSAYERIQGRQWQADQEAGRMSEEDAAQGPPDGWLSALTVQEGPEADIRETVYSSTPWRASDLGIIPYSLEYYLELLDWTGRQIRSDKPSAIPAHLAPILERLGIRESFLIEVVKNLTSIFRRGVGRLENLRKLAQRAGRKRLSGMRMAAEAFT
jgi:hypothetical protein